MTLHRTFHLTSRLRALALSLTSLKISSKWKGVVHWAPRAPCLWVLMARARMVTPQVGRFQRSEKAVFSQLVP